MNTGHLLKLIITSSSSSGLAAGLRLLSLIIIDLSYWTDASDRSHGSWHADSSTFGWISGFWDHPRAFPVAIDPAWWSCSLWSYYSIESDHIFHDRHPRTSRSLFLGTRRSSRSCTYQRRSCCPGGALEHGPGHFCAYSGGRSISFVSSGWSKRSHRRGGKGACRPCWNICCTCHISGT